MTQGAQLPPEGPGNEDVVGAVLGPISKALVPRGYLTTEWWTTILGGALSAVLALVHVSGSTATHVAAVVAPTVLAALYAITRTMHKSALASVLSGVFPQAAGAATAAGGPTGAGAVAGAGTPASPAADQAAAQSTAASSAAAPVTQTDPGFFFQGIPPIEDDNG